MLQDGAIVDGKYRIIRSLGGGAMGKVYQAEKVTTHERFAIKFIHDYLTADDVYCARFEREVNALRGIRHPHVVDVFDWKLPKEQKGGLAYIVMEYLQGESLQQVIQRREGIAVQEMIRVMLQVLDGLVAVHGLGIIHRDLSPSNICLVGPDPAWRSAKILDFGLAKEAEPGRADADGGVTQDGAVLGRAAYAAPEMFLGRDLDVRADVFACGMIMYRGLARRFPYRESRTDLIWVERYSQRFEEGRPYPPARTFEKSIPPGVDLIISRALAKRVSSRYATAAEMQAALVEAESAFGKSVRWQPPDRRQSDPPGPGDVTAGETTARVNMDAILADDVSSTPSGAPSDVSTGDRALHGDRSASSVGRRPSALARLARRPTVLRAAAAGVAAVGALALVLALLLRRGSGDDRVVVPPVAAADAASAAPPAEPDAGPTPEAAVEAGADAAAVEAAVEVAVAPEAGEVEAVPEEASLPAKVTVTLAGLPEDARAEVGGVAVVDGVVVLERSEDPVAVKVTARGFLPYESELVPSVDQTFFVLLEERTGTPGGGVRRDGGTRGGSGSDRPPRPPRPPPPPPVLDAGTGIGIIVDYDDP